MRLLVAASALVAAGPAFAQRWQPFASGSAFGTFDMSNVPLIAEEAEGDEGTDLRSGYTFTGSAGARWLLPRNTGQLSYTLGVSTIGDPLKADALKVESDNIVHGLQGYNTTRLGPWWRLELGQNFFWGVNRVEQDISAIGGANPADGQGGPDPIPVPTGTPGGVAPGGATDPQVLDLGGGAFALHEVPYIRTDSSIGIGYDRGLYWATGLTATFGIQRFLEDQPFVQRTREGRLVVRPLFDTYSLGGAYNVTYRHGERQRYNLAFDAQTTWLTEHELDPELAARAIDENAIGTDGVAETTTTQTLGARAGFAWDFATNWSGDLNVGGELFFPVSDPDQQRLDGIGSLGVSRNVEEWQLRAELRRDVNASELGAVFATSALALGARGNVLPRVQGQITASASRQDVLLLVVEENVNPRDVDPSRYEGYSVDGTAKFDWLLGFNTVATFAYSASQWFSDDEATRSLLSHRILVGVTIGTDAAEVGGNFAGAGREAADPGY